MEVNEKLRALIFEVIQNQIKINNPPETKLTYDRLTKLGFDEETTNQYIGQCFAVELFDIMKHHKLYNEKRYIKNLQNLPEEPFDKK